MKNESNEMRSAFADAYDRGMQAGRVLEVPGGRPVMVLADDACLHNLEGYQDHPARVRQTVTVTDATSFLDYLKDFAVAGATRVFADASGLKFNALIDYHAASDKPSHCTHSVVLNLRISPQFTAWKSMVSKGSVCHGDAAEFLEERMGDITSPDSADVLEAAQGLHMESEAKISSVQSLSGAKRLQFESNERVKAHGVDAPERLILSIPVFEDFPAQPVHVRIVYRVKDQRLLMRFRILNLDELVSAEFKRIAGEIHSNDLPTYFGTVR